MKGKGYIADPAGHRKTSHRFMATSFAAPPPNKQLLVPGIYDQGQTGSCTGHAMAQAIWTMLGGNQPSPIAPYDGGRLLDMPPDPTIPLQDNGAEPNQVMRAGSVFGVPSAAIYGRFPADPATINDRPTLYALMAGSYAHIAGAYGILSSGDQFALDIIAAIANGFPVTVATATGYVFNSYVGGVIGLPDGPVDHYVCAVGYAWDGTNASSIVLEIVNSWGQQWGEPSGMFSGGFLRGNRAFIDQLQDAYICDVRYVQ
jgi:hypothetical protein